jgi:Uma2 family endonuclease
MAARRAEARTLTLKEWAELPEDDDGELVDGRLVEEEVATGAHEQAVAWLCGHLLGFLEGRGGDVLGSNLKYAVGARLGRKPDLSVFLPGRSRLDSEAMLTTVPADIMIEVITPTPRDHARDRIDKAREYARFGVRWYWLVDPAAQTIEILELGPKRRYTKLTTASSGRLKVPGCRGLELDLDALWRYVRK